MLLDWRSWSIEPSTLLEHCEHDDEGYAGSPGEARPTTRRRQEMPDPRWLRLAWRSGIRRNPRRRHLHGQTAADVGLDGGHGYPFPDRLEKRYPYKTVLSI